MLPFHNAFHSVSSGNPAIWPLVLRVEFIGIMTLNISGVVLNKRWLNRVATVSAVIHVSLVENSPLKLTQLPRSEPRPYL